MHFDLIRPCGNCPFRSDQPGYLRPDRIRQILGGDRASRKWWPAPSFPCHKTIDYRDDRARIPATAQQCAGVMIILAREGRFNDAMQLGERFGIFDPSKLDMDAQVYRSTEEAIAEGR